MNLLKLPWIKSRAEVIKEERASSPGGIFLKPGEEVIPPRFDGFDPFPIGTRFEYLGRQMVVFAHVWTGFPYAVPEVEAEYADDNGKLHTWVFPLGTLATFCPAQPKVDAPPPVDGSGDTLD
jgi:hypothetical protein